MPGPHSVDYYVQRSSAGVLITEATVISPQGMGWAGAPGIYTPEHVAGWKTVTSAVKAHNPKSIFYVQLWHMGRVTHSDFHGLQPVSPSDVTCSGNAWVYDKVKKPYEQPRPLELSEIVTLKEEYRNAAQCAKDAGFDGIEIHSANGYLLDQFLQPVTNKRSDEFGGSKENRFRLLKEVLEVCGTVFPYNRIAVRLSPNGQFNDMGGSSNHEDFTFFISQLEPYKLGYLHIMDGLAFGFHEKCPVFRASDARKVYSGVICGNCGYTRESATGAVNTGALDAVAFGRLYLSNPDLVERFRNNWPLADVPAFPTWYESPGDDFEDSATQAVGYSDYPTYTPSAEEK